MGLLQSLHEIASGRAAQDYHRDGAGQALRSSTKSPGIVAWGGGRTSASFSPQKRDTGSIGELRHVARLWKPYTSNPGWWPKDKTIFFISLCLRIHPGVN